jgi:lipoate-protein ligase A
MSVVEWDVIPPTPHPAHVHMALDEVLLERVIAGVRKPTLRIWEWIEPALVIGSHQSVANEVDVDAASELGFVVTRRMSGGGTMLCEPDRTITYSLYLPESVVAGVSFRKSYALLDDWAVRTFVELGVPAEYREINDIISPRGKIAGAAQARRRGFVLHHTTIAHSMEAELLERLIRIGRPDIAEIGVRSANKTVSPLSWFTTRSCAEVALDLALFFSSRFRTHPSQAQPEELEAALHLVSTKYATPAWVNRLP